MINRDDIVASFPSSLHVQKEHMLREYLQHQILEIIFTSKRAEKVCFIWWTVLRLWYGNNRFSEDLDFDNKDLSFNEFQDLITHIQQALALKNIVTEYKSMQKWAFHGYFKFPNILYDFGITSMKTQKLLIQIDTVDQWYVFEYEKKYVSKYWTLSLWNIAPLSLLLSHKILTAFNRKRKKWRDFFDLLFILKKTKVPDYTFLTEKLWLTSPEEISSYILWECSKLDFDYLQKDVQPFLFNQQDFSVKMFPDIISQVRFEQ